MLYSFWMIVIGFSMLSLIMTYTYQFDGFSDHWSKYFKIPYELYKLNLINQLLERLAKI